jgi:hypothetical protein
MSHITEREPDSEDQALTNLTALTRAAERCGLELVADKQTFTMYQGEQVDCLHTFRIPLAEQRNDNDKYEVGVVASKKFKDAYSLQCDFYGRALEPRVGSRFDTILMRYQQECVRIQLEEQGFETDSIQLETDSSGVEHWRVEVPNQTLKALEEF